MGNRQQDQITTHKKHCRVISKVSGHESQHGLTALTTHWR